MVGWILEKRVCLYCMAAVDLFEVQLAWSESKTQKRTNSELINFRLDIPQHMKSVADKEFSTKLRSTRRHWKHSTNFESRALGFCCARKNLGCMSCTTSCVLWTVLRLILYIDNFTSICMFIYLWFPTVYQSSLCFTFRLFYCHWRCRVTPWQRHQQPQQPPIW